MTGSHTERVKNPKPYSWMAGHAPATNDNRIPTNAARVKMAAPRAAQANNLSIKSVKNRARVSGGVVMGWAVGSRPNEEREGSVIKVDM